MMKRKLSRSFLIMVCFLSFVVPIFAQRSGMQSITIDGLKIHMNILAAEDFLGRDTPSQGLNITSRYLASIVESYGFKPLIPDGSFYQKIPLEIFTINESRTKIVLSTDYGDQVYYFPDAFGIGGSRKPQEGTFAGSVVFIGYGISAPDLGWDDYANVDVKGKIVVMLDGYLPRENILNQPQYRNLSRNRAIAAARRGATAVLTVINEVREGNFLKNGLLFDNYERGIFIDDPTPRRDTTRISQIEPIVQAEIRHDLASAILGISGEELRGMFKMLSLGEQVQPKELSEKKVTITVNLRKRTGYTQNVVACLEGKNPKFKDEYILYGSHQDHLGIREDMIYNGADDNVSGTVAMLEVAKAMAKEKPGRSIIMVWHTGEEKGLKGSYYFINNCPVPVEKISAVINFDMISRNHPDSLYLVASRTLSTELDESIHRMNDKYSVGLNFDYKYENINHPNQFYSRSDHYPYNLFGIPGVWLFCGTTRDYHQITDTIDRIDYNKMLKVTKLAYLVGYDIGNKKELLKLDVYPEITTRGKHNIQVQLVRKNNK